MTDIDDLIARLIRAHEAAGFGSIYSSLLYAAASALREQRDEIVRLRILVSPAAEQAMRDLAIRAERAEAEVGRLKAEIASKK